MAKTGSNPVAQVLQHMGDFYEWRDYPEGGVWDRASGYGYFYHAHPGAAFEGEHGHFHLFWALDPSERTNLAALSMSHFGRFLGAFVANSWHVPLSDPAELRARYEGFRIELSFPCLAANYWLGAVVRGLSDPLLQLHGRAFEKLKDPKVAADRGKPVILAQPLDLQVPVKAAIRPTVKQMRR